MRKVITAPRRPDVTEIVHLLFEALTAWAGDKSPTEDLNTALSQLSDCDVELKSVERSTSNEDSVNVYLTDGTSYKVSVKRTDNNFR